jgi:hypothetical protein
MQVIAPKGCVCFKEGSRDVIDDVTPQDIPDSLYYRRRLAGGELLIVVKPVSTPVAPTKKGKVI